VPRLRSCAVLVLVISACGVVAADGRYTLSVGSSSRDLPDSAGFELGGNGHR
jgi:hypothetical protein